MLQEEAKKDRTSMRAMLIEVCHAEEYYGIDSISTLAKRTRKCGKFVFASGGALGSLPKHARTSVLEAPRLEVEVQRTPQTSGEDEG